jgi:hypothetical protein
MICLTTGWIHAKPATNSTGFLAVPEPLPPGPAIACHLACQPQGEQCRRFRNNKKAY